MIPEIRINNIGVGNVGIGDVQQVDVQTIGVRSPKTIRVADNRIWVVNPPNATQLDPPVVVQVGTPIVNIAGCVEVHKENARTRNRNKQLVPDLNSQPLVNYTQESFRKYGSIKVHNFVQSL